MKDRRKAGGILLLLVTACVLLTACRADDAERTGFGKTIDRIRTDFSYEGYEEILDDYSYILAIPMEYEKVVDSDNIMMDQKLFVFKNAEKGVSITVQMIFHEQSQNLWNSSFHYTGQMFNSPEGDYQSSYAPSIPDVEIASVSFTYDHCTYTLTALSPQSEDNLLAATEVVGLANALIDFIT